MEEDDPLDKSVDKVGDAGHDCKNKCNLWRNAEVIVSSGEVAAATEEDKPAFLAGDADA